ncbi:MAG: DUF4272 domain-containing protein [Saprospiraceae bacterium]
MNSKTAIERKLETEKYLKELKIPYIDHLPTIEEESETLIRTAESISKRILILTYLCYVGEEEDGKEEVVKFLKKYDLWEETSPNEKELLISKKELTNQDRINISWKSECIWLLLWVIGKFEKLELPIQEASIPEILEYIPEFMTNPSNFIKTAKLRNKSEIMDASDLNYRLHWATRNAELNNEDSTKLNPSVVMERHYAINWVTNYEGLEWDKITTDT